MVRTGDRKEIAKVINTLMRKRIEAELQEKKLFEQDRKLLNSAQNILFREMAITLNISFEEINQMVTSLIEKNK
jgi:CarD family transcriptional regulator